MIFLRLSVKTENGCGNKILNHHKSREPFVETKMREHKAQWRQNTNHYNYNTSELLV